MRVLVVEDDASIANLVRQSLTEHDVAAEVVGDGIEGLLRADEQTYDVLLLDIMLPGMSGTEVCRQLRRQGNRTPVLMLTARDAVADRVQGLDAGADDYLVKPFALEEMLARVRALARRSRGVAEDELLRVGDLTLNVARREAQREQRPIELTAKEFDLLAYLARGPGRVFTKDQIVENVWGHATDPGSNVLETYIHYLRNKVDRGFTRPLIRTVRGVGYTLKP